MGGGGDVLLTHLARKKIIDDISCDGIKIMGLSGYQRCIFHKIAAPLGRSQGSGCLSALMKSSAKLKFSKRRK